MHLLSYSTLIFNQMHKFYVLCEKSDPNHVTIHPIWLQARNKGEFNS